jgi:hypothetical protein
MSFITSKSTMRKSSMDIQKQESINDEFVKKNHTRKSF